MLSTACLQTTSNQLLLGRCWADIDQHAGQCIDVGLMMHHFLCKLSAKYSDLKRTFKSILLYVFYTDSKKL